MVLAELSRRFMINKIKKQAFLFQNKVFCINLHYFSISQTMFAYTTIRNTPFMQTIASMPQNSTVRPVILLYLFLKI